MGDAVVDASNYTVSGTENTVVTFANTYLDSLVAGEYQITINYGDEGSVETALTIKAKPVELMKYRTTNGTVAIEAEDVIADNTLITVKGDEDAADGSNGKVASITARGDIEDKTPTAAPAMGFEITPDQAGTYYVWVRVYRNVSEEDSDSKATAAYMSLAEQNYATLSFKDDSVKTYYWKKLGSVAVEEESAAQSVSVRFKTHSNSLWFDKFIVTTDDLNGTEEIFVVDPVVTPEIVAEETVGEYTIGSNAEVTIKTTGEFSKFESVKMGDAVVDASNYTVTGTENTIVTFTNTYLDTLAAGAYSVTISYNDGSSVETTLTIIEKVATITLKKYGVTEGTSAVTGIGTVAIEAEDVIVDGSANIEVAYGVTDKNGAVASKEKVAKIKNNVAEGASTTAEMGFDIIPNQNGTYYVWTRLYRKDSREDKAYAVQLSMNEAAYGLWNFKNNSNPQEYTWILMKEVEVDVAVDNTISVCFIPRFKDLWFDKFIVTTDDTFTPTGTGDVSSGTE